jgi:O-antigen ligase
MKIEFRSTPEYFSIALLILGPFFFWFGMEILAYIVIFLGIISSTFTILKNPLSGVYMTIFFLPLTKKFNLPFFGIEFGLPIFLFTITFLAYILKENLISNQNLMRYRKNYYLIPLGLFLFFGFLSVVNAISIKKWAVEVASYIFLTVFFLFFIHVLDSREKIDNTIKILIFSLSIVIVLGFLGYIFLSLFNLSNPLLSRTFRLTSTFKGTAQFPMSVFVGFYLLVNEVERRMKLKETLGALIFLLICVIGVFDLAATGSRVVLLILLPIMLFYVILHYFTSTSNKFSIVGVVLVFVVICLIYVPIELSTTRALNRSTRGFQELPQMSFEGIISIQKGESEIVDFVNKSDTPRAHQLEALFGMIKDYPLLGVGAGNFGEQMMNYTDFPRRWRLHNTFLSILAETGFLGFISFALFLISIFIIGIKKSLTMKSEKYRNYLLMIMLGLISTLMFQMVQLGLRNQFMWLGFALLIGINKSVEK